MGPTTTTRAEALGATVVRIELFHASLIACIWLALSSTKLVAPGALLAGGVFMAINFLLLSSGIHWVLTPFAGKGRIRSGVVLLVLKMAVFLGAISLLLTRIKFDPLSFTLGFSSLLIAILLERVWALSR
jgi:hypothetical protein